LPTYTLVVGFHTSVAFAGKEQTKLTWYLQDKLMVDAHRLWFSFMKNDWHGTLQVMMMTKQQQERIPMS